MMATGQHRTVGTVLISEPGKPQVEIKTFTCCHCNGIVMVEHKAGAAGSGGFCGQCWAPTCFACGKIGRCTPFERRLEKIEGRARLLKSMGLE